jgi:two-component SAPR family response regulator
MMAPDNSHTKVPVSPTLFSGERMKSTGPTTPDTSLAGTKILVVEDDYFVATNCADILREHGASILGPVPDMERALQTAIDEVPDCVLLDLNLKGVIAYELAEAFIRSRIPTIITTGYDESMLPASLRRLPYLLKPVETRVLLNSVQREIGSRRLSTA